MYNLIVAFDNNRGIGRENKLPWHFPEDLKYFSKLTRGNGNNAIIMGKNTWESIPNKPLKERDNLILSTTLDIEENTPKNSYVKSFNSIDKLEDFCNNQKYDEVWIIGGSKIYNLFIDQNKIKYIYATLIDKKYECDCFFPALRDWTITNEDDNIYKETKISYLKYEKSNF